MELDREKDNQGTSTARAGTSLSIIAAVLWTASFWNAAALFSLIGRHAFQIIYRDQWYYPAMMMRALARPFDLQVYTSWISQHRSILPRILSIQMGKLTQWNLLYDVWFNVFLSACLFLVLLFQLRRARLLKGAGGASLAAAVFLCVFSARGYLCWLWGYCSVQFLCVFGAAASLALLSGKVFSWRRFLFGTLFALVSNFSYSAGLAAWPIGLFLLFTREYQGGGRQKAAAIFSWVLIFSAAFLYYQNIGRLIEERVWHGWYRGGDPAGFLSFMFSYLGALLFPGNHPRAFLYSSIVGAAGFSLFLLLNAYLAKESRGRFRELLGFAALGLFPVLNAPLISFSRFGLGMDFSLKSLYIPFTALFWISVLILLAGAAEAAKEKGRPFVRRTCLIIFFVLSAVILQASFRSHAPLAQKGEEVRELARAFVMKQPSQDRLSHFRTEELWKWRAFLIENRLTVFRSEAALAAYLKIPVREGYLRALEEGL